MEVNGSGKHSSLLRYCNNCCRRNFFKTGLEPILHRSFGVNLLNFFHEIDHFTATGKIVYNNETAQLSEQIYSNKLHMNGSRSSSFTTTTFFNNFGTMEQRIFM
jgi:hypothetical protein